jgi:hypothetical protein
MATAAPTWVPSDPADPKSRVFTYTPKKVRDELAGKQNESAAQYVERLKKAMAWYAEPKVQVVIGKRRISDLKNSSPRR